MHAFKKELGKKFRDTNGNVFVPCHLLDFLLDHL